jgi:hypothetical protein
MNPMLMLGESVYVGRYCDCYSWIQGDTYLNHLLVYVNYYDALQCLEVLVE